jgi:hypothetical protein
MTSKDVSTQWTLSNGKRSVERTARNDREKTICNCGCNKTLQLTGFLAIISFISCRF